MIRLSKCKICTTVEIAFFFFFSGKALLGPLLFQACGEQQQVPLLACWGRGPDCSLHGVRVGVCPGVGPEAWLKQSAHHSGGC